MIDFTKCIEELNSYKGSEKKKTLIYNNKKYLVKFPDPIREKNKDISYINNAFSEYIGSNIFEIIGFKTQNTILGIYNYNEKEKIVCACEDFLNEDTILFEFESIALSINPDKKITTDLTDIIEVINESKLLNTNLVKEKFYDMFIVDYLIGNTNRHNGDWGFIYNKKNKKLDFAPIYDCGSCFNPLLDDKQIEELNENEIKNLAINCYSCLKENNKKINYITYLKSMKNDECNKAILRVFKKIDTYKIISFIKEIECMSKIRKDFYIKIISIRYNILKDIYNKLAK